MKLLLVEDDPASMSYLEIVVRKEGYEYKTAPDGQIGLELFRSFNPDMVISDINMVNMDGLEMLRRILIRSASNGEAPPFPSSISTMTSASSMASCS